MANQATAGHPVQMLTKFESKSSRVKGIAFHPKRPWLLTSLHNGCIQLWDYRMGSLLDRFEEHDGAVRAVDFHKTQPLFVSGGDDYKIRVWNYKTRKCLFTLSGHLDYVRTVFFHHEYPWILSCSDDQTIRIWNWQSRNCIALISGHSHYVMCAQFHPKEDLIVSASLDQTVRVWDISGLRKKNAAPQSMSLEEQLQRSQAGQGADLFGNTDCVVKYVLEGHDRGVNWASFHPTKPLIISAGDDRNVKLWRMSDTKAWEVDTCRGHFNNASCAIFHPTLDLMLSVGEDKMIRIWDLNKRTAVQAFRRENDRFWVITAHPTFNLFAVGHDAGVMVFRLERERPAITLDKNIVYYIDKQKMVQTYDSLRQQKGTQPVMALRKFGGQWTQPKSISYNPAEKLVLATSVREVSPFLLNKPSDNESQTAMYELFEVPQASSSAETLVGLKGTGHVAFFTARNRFAVLNCYKHVIEIRDLNNDVIKSMKAPADAHIMFHAGAGQVLIGTAHVVILFDLTTGTEIASARMSSLKNVALSPDGNFFGLVGKHAVFIVDKQMKVKIVKYETIRCKGACWDDSGVLIYATLNHIKYLMPSGDHGIIKTLDETIYLVKSKGKQLLCFDRLAQPQVLLIDPTEYKFKLALVKKNYDEMFSIIKNSNLVGQSIIAYVQKHGFPEIALQFVQDPQTRFELAIESGDLTVASKEAKEIDKPEIWKRLSVEAMRQGNHTTVEMCYQRLKAFEKLSFLYLTIGDRVKLQKMNKIAVSRGDYMAQFQTSLYLGDVKARVTMLRETGMIPLAYMTAKSHGLTDLASEILSEAGISESDIKLPTHTPKALTPAAPRSTASKANWPLSEAKEADLVAILAAAGVDAEDEPLETGSASNEDFMDAELESDEDEGGWEMDDIPIEEADQLDELFSDNVDGGLSEPEIWQRASPVPADHIAAGAFESAMQLLNRQVGIVNFAPLQERFMEIYAGSRAYTPGHVGMPALVTYLRRNPLESNIQKSLPRTPKLLGDIQSNDLAEAYKLVKANKLAEAVEAFRGILYSVLLTSTLSKEEVETSEELIDEASEYIQACQIELKRRELYPPKAELTPEQVKHNLELACYFTDALLQPPHRYLALQNAMRIASLARNNKTAAYFAQQLLDLNPDGKATDQAKKVLAAADRNNSDAVQINFDISPDAEFDICPASMTPITAQTPSTTCGFCGAVYLAKYRGQLCRIGGIEEIGADVQGRKIMVTVR
ncbi:coatomer alpha subunit [Protomyces lactucae-debilis]|uniref:Coatomer subunit alpha n=1 Tax=Protomyces lactucae-debilis TaxID=2754530 RepID=A0A1Y2F6H9_PROLT|nr:coatomer alpha subunit [Protomyces lactucae-debilis]ORY79491.1 coatomer alpha subunit [Protomyces lactucae-debilis]